MSKNLESYIKAYGHCLLGRPCVDAGLFENKILSLQDDKVKQGFRIAKYFLQCVHDKAPVELADQFTFTNLRPFYKTVVPSLYACKPCIRSYFLKICLLRLVFYTSGTTCADRLHGGVLALCLLDMLYHICLNKGLLRHPIQDTWSFIVIQDSDQTTVPNLSKALNVLMSATDKDVCKFDLFNDVGLSGFYGEDDSSAKLMEYPIPNHHVVVK